MIERQAIQVGIGIAAVAAMGWPICVQALEVSVRGESHLQFEAKSAGSTLVVDGLLYDDIGQPLPGRKIEVTVVQERDDVVREGVHTDFYGHFLTVVELPPGDYQLEVDFAGSDQVSGVSGAESMQVIEAPTELELEAPSWISGDVDEVPIVLRAQAGGHGLPAFASLTHQGRPLATVDLDERGEALYDLGPHLEEGENIVEVEVPATEYRDRAREVKKIRHLVDPKISGDIERVFRRMTRGVEVEVAVEDKTGPLEDADVEIELVSQKGSGEDEGGGESLVFDSVTGSDGRASVVISDAELGDRRWEVTARIVPPLGEPLLWDGGDVYREPSLWGRVVVASATVVLVLGLVWLGRRGAFLLWARWQRFLRRRRDEEQGEGREHRREARKRLAAVEEASLQAMETEADKSAHEPGVYVQLWDEWRDEAVEGASVEVCDPEGAVQRVEAEKDGGVELEVGVDGEWKIRARAPGYVEARTTIEAPVKAESLRLVMTPVPLKIRRAYRWMVRRAKGSDDWGRLTPRQIEAALGRVEAAGQSEASPEPGRSWRQWLEGWEDLEDDERVETLLRAVTAVVEETNFSGRLYEAEVWEATRLALEELARCLDAGRRSGD